MGPAAAAPIRHDVPVGQRLAFFQGEARGFMPEFLPALPEEARDEDQTDDEAEDDDQVVVKTAKEGERMKQAGGS